VFKNIDVRLAGVLNQPPRDGAKAGKNMEKSVEKIVESD
jgi:hypothetical protein